MNHSLIRIFFVLTILMSGQVFVCNGQTFRQNYSSRPDRALFGKSLDRKKQAKVKEPRAVTKARKKQEENERKQDREYDEYVKNSRKRSLEIQTPEVRERMMANRAESDERYKARRKKVAMENRKTGNKYRR